MYNSIWYNLLTKSSLNPPAWVFAPVWTILYITLAVSLFLYLKDGYEHYKLPALKLFGAQLVLNLLWSPIFFGLKNPLFALLIVVLMIFCTIGIIVLFYRESKASGLLLLPYLAWISFAMFLNFEIVRLN